MDEIHDAPQIEQAIFQRRAGEREAVLGFQLLHRLRDLRAGVLDELRFVENHGAEGEFLQFLEVAPQQRVIGDDDIVLRNFFAQAVARRAAFEHEHFQVRRETVGFAPPVVQHGRGANDERGLVVLFVLRLQPREPGEGLQRFAETHVVGQNAAEPDLREMAEEIETVLLIRPQIGLDGVGKFGRGDAFEILEVLAQGRRLAANRRSV